MMAKQTFESDHSINTQRAAAMSVTDSFMKHTVEIARECRATAVFVYVDALRETAFRLPEDPALRFFYVTKTAGDDEIQKQLGGQIIRVPNVPLTRLGQIKIAVLLALSQKLVNHGDKILFLSGMAESGSLDMLVVVEIGTEFEMFFASGNDEIAPNIQPEVIARVIDLAAELGKEGREGKPVGALFIIGDTERVLSLSRQLILNPFQGYPEEQRNILDPRLEETVKEFASLDGAFVLQGHGTIETAGTYLKTATRDDYRLPQGLGSRHHAAAAITDLSESVAVTVSESTGTVTVFRGGRIITEIEKPRSLSN